jgi:hypothetical protein
MALIDEAFGENLTAAEKVDRSEAFKSSIDNAVKRAERGIGRTYDHRLGRHVGMDEERAAAVEQLQSLQKSVGPEQQALIQASLDELSKDLMVGTNFTNTFFGGDTGVPGNLRPIDLEGPAKILVPRFTPLVNETSRVKGVGGARTYRRILGYTNANMGGVPDQDIFLDSEFNSGTLPTFGSLSLRRGQKISYAMDEHSVPYVEASVSDLVTTKSYFSSLGYENLRGLSAMAMLWAHKLGEEKAMLFGRGSAAGYAGNYATTAPTAATALTVPASAPSQIPAGTFAIAFTARAGVGETVAGVATTTPLAIATANTDSLTVAVPTAAVGSYGTNVYASSTGASVGTWFLGFIPAGELAASIAFNTLGVQISASSAAYPSVNTTSNNGYDGLLTVLSGSLSGYANSTAYTVWNGTTGTGDQFIQDTCEVLYQNVYADPDEVWLNVATSRKLGDFLKSQPSATASSFRIDVDNAGAIVGANVTGVYNQSSPTRRMLGLRVHPYMPYGQSIIRSRTLDIPDSGIGETSEIVAVQEYQSYEWPQVQFTYDASTYWMGTYVHYAPAWSGACTALS